MEIQHGYVPFPLSFFFLRNPYPEGGSKALKKLMPVSWQFYKFPALVYTIGIVLLVVKHKL